MLTVFIISTIFTFLVTVLPLSKQTHWVIRGMDFPRFQIVLFILCMLTVFVFWLVEPLTLTLPLIVINIICLLWQLWWILPYTLLWPKEVKTVEEGNPERRLSIITSNVLTTNKNSQALIDLVHQYQPDILVTLESDKWWEEQLSVLEADMPYTVKCPLDNLYGIHLYSKLKLHEEEICYLVQEGVPSIHACIELGSGDKIRAHFVHPAPPSPTENTRSSERDAELVVVAKSVAKSDMAVLVAGDLNDVAWSPTTRLFRKISGLLDPRIGRGMYNTFHAKLPFLRWPLDHLFHSDHFTLNAIKRLPSIGSDHFPLFTSLFFNVIERPKQDGLEADAADHERTEEIADAEGVSEEDVPKPTEDN